MMVIKNRHSIAGIWWLLAFTFVMGYFIGPLVGYALGAYSNGAQLVGIAVGGTAAIFFGLAGYATVTKRDFPAFLSAKHCSSACGCLLPSVLLMYFFKVPPSPWRVFLVYRYRLRLYFIHRQSHCAWR